MEGQVIVVTGAGGHGVGSGVCDALAEAGATLVLNDVDEGAVREAASRYPGSLAVAADLRASSAADAVLAGAVERFGRVDALVNNAGVGLDRPAHEATEEDFDRLFSLNVRGLWLATRAFARYRIGVGGGGAVVNISSVHAQHTQSGYSLYAGTKGAVEGLTRGFATELGQHRIQCTALAPGAVLDERVADRYGLPGPDPIEWIRAHARTQQTFPDAVRPVDVGRVVAFLLSPAAWAMAGQTVTVDAGLSVLLYDRRQSRDEE